MVETKGLGWSADGGDRRVWVSSFGSWVSSMRERERERERERLYVLSFLGFFFYFFIFILFYKKVL